MPAETLLLSQIIIGYPQITNFEDFLDIVRKHGEQHGKVFLEMDLKPEYPDTPRNWAFLVEGAYTGGKR